MTCNNVCLNVVSTLGYYAVSFHVIVFCMCSMDKFLNVDIDLCHPATTCCCSWDLTVWTFSSFSGYHIFWLVNALNFKGA